jgi:dUTP pyrophosphatase
MNNLLKKRIIYSIISNSKIMELHILCDNDDVKDMYENHKHFHNGDSGLDLYFPENVELPPKSFGTLVSFGIKCEGLKHGDNISYYLYPRSSISKTPLRMSNSVGIIDAGYRGNIMAALDNHSDEPYVIKKGTRLFQICCPILSQINMKVVDELSDTSRDTGGFGSTGK